MASSLPPPAPSATNGAVQTRARDSDSPGDLPQCAAGRTSDDDEDNSRFLDQLAAPSDGHIDGVLPRLTSYAGAGTRADPPVPPAQIGAMLDRTDQAIKEFTKTTQRDDHAPVPPAQISADFEGINAPIKELQKTPPDVENVPLHPSQIATDFNDVNKAIEVPPPTDQGRSPSSPRGQQQLPIQPPPQSMMPSPGEDADAPASTLPSDPSVPMLEATLVEDQPETPVYDAIQVAEQTRFERNKKIIVGVGTGLLIGTAVTAGVLVSSNNGTRGKNTIEPKVLVLSTTHPSESSSPSDIPSLRPTLRPSQTLTPSTSLRPTASLRPSLTSSLPPSSLPTAAPPIYCGEINILTDEYYYESSWDLVRIDTIGGTSYTTVVLEGSPEEAGHHTYEACLESGDYEFAIFDSFDDGIQSPGYYRVIFDGVVIAQGGEFGSEEKVSFSLPPPSPQPSESSSPSETPSSSPSPQPSESESRPPSETPSSSLRPSESSSPSETPSSSLQPSPLPSSPPSTYWSTLNWSRQGLGFNGDASNDIFGYAVAFSADASTMAVGAPGYWKDDDRPGYVKVYHREGEGSSWEQRGETIHGEANGDAFGHSLALSNNGKTLSIGAPHHDSVDGDSAGQAKVYRWDETVLNYVQIGDTLYGVASYGHLGISLDIANGTVLAVGASNSDANGHNSGQVTIYAWDEASSNFQQRGEAINGVEAGDSFGGSVSLAENGQKLAIGAPGNDSNGRNSGQVRLFEWDGATSNYEQLGDPLLGDAAGDYFGWSVSFSRDGTTLAIGAPLNKKNGEESGQVKVFALDEPSSNFVQIGKSLYGEAADDHFGMSAVLSSEGSTLAIGARQGSKPGYVKVYGWDKATSEYKQLGQSLGGKGIDDHFGQTLALAGNGRDLAIGAWPNRRNGIWSGRVEVFDIEL